MREPRRISTALAIEVHAAQLALFGGPTGIRDKGLLESALDRPRNKWTYGATILALAAGELEEAELAAWIRTGLSRS